MTRSGHGPCSIAVEFKVGGKTPWAFLLCGRYALPVRANGHQKRPYAKSSTVRKIESMRKLPIKTSGEIGSTTITATPEGQTAEIVHTELPLTKEGLEQFFGSRFVTTFNETRPLGEFVDITNLEQNDTNDLDFKITCTAADYMELAELNPRSETFGRYALRDGKLNVYEYAKWIFNRLIKKKALSYGPAVASRTILLVYVTYWQFRPSERVIECIQSHIQVHGCTFAAVFVLVTNGNDLRVLALAHPVNLWKLAKPSAYAAFKYWNLPPGQSTWTIPTS